MVVKRLLKLILSYSFFLFGARSTGKSTLLRQTFNAQNSLWIDLLDPNQEEIFARNPGELRAIVLALPETIQHVVLDEIQKVPKLLDVVHDLIEKTNKKFIMIGSSARKLKKEGANLLAGRAFVFHLFPFSYLELGNQFKLQEALHWGMLPKIYSFSEADEKRLFLQAYTQTYLQEEIRLEQLVRKLEPFRRFLEVAAQSNGKIINYSNIARDVGVDDKTVKEYFEILEDTLLGFFLEPFKHSFRKRLSSKPKFYFFDCGVVRALARQLSISLQPATSAYGDSFEHFIILECLKLAKYFKPEWRFSYLRTQDDVEVDLIVERPGQSILFIEIKSNSNVQAEHLRSFIKLVDDFKQCEAICFSNDQYTKQIGSITVLPWDVGIKQYFGQDELPQSNLL
ncbi:MAG: ATP-binding protein [Proteobacteria bacterium]|nr:ATP-binding protein [Pseudomonadota bacterium]